MTFGYEGHDAHGSPKKGAITASTVEEAASSLRKSGIFAMHIEPGEVAKPVLNHPSTEAELDNEIRDQLSKSSNDPNLVMVENHAFEFQPQKSIGEFLGVQPNKDDSGFNTDQYPHSSGPEVNQAVPHTVITEEVIDSVPDDDLTKNLFMWAEIVSQARRLKINDQDLRPAAVGFLREILVEEYKRRHSQDKTTQVKRKKKSRNRNK